MYKFNQDNQWIQLNMTLVPDIDTMSVGLEQAIFTVPIMDNKKNNKAKNSKILHNTNLQGERRYSWNDKTLSKKTFT